MHIRSRIRTPISNGKITKKIPYIKIYGTNSANYFNLASIMLFFYSNIPHGWSKCRCRCLAIHFVWTISFPEVWIHNPKPIVVQCIRTSTRPSAYTLRIYLRSSLLNFIEFIIDTTYSSFIKDCAWTLHSSPFPWCFGKDMFVSFSDAFGASISFVAKNDDNFSLSKSAA